MRHHVSALAVAGVLFAFAQPASAKSCEETIAASFTTFVRQHMKLVQHCRELVLTGRMAGPCPDYRTGLLIEKTRAKLRTKVNQACGGADKTCGFGGDDIDLADVGWNVGQCPNIRDGACTNAIHHCGDVADCLQCIGETAVARATALVYDELSPSSALSQVGRCQKTIGQSVRRYLDATFVALATCEQTDFQGPVPGGSCPDLLKAQPRLARAEEKIVDRICHSCGSSDQTCGGDDLLPDWIGFVDQCPDVTVPSGESCARPIHQLVDIIECVRCVTDFQVGCLDPLSVPMLKAYPGSCPPP